MTVTTSLAIPCLLLFGAPTEMTREEFTRELAKIKMGEAKAVVAERLGKPDKVYERQCDTAAMQYFPDAVHEVWGYGITRAGDGGDFAALGCVGFGDSGAVVQLYGSRGSPYDTGIGESELRTLLGHIDAIGEIGGRAFNPLFLIRAVNVLRTHDKKHVVAIVSEYDRLWSPMSRTDAWGIALLFQTLLEDFPSDAPPPSLGVTIPHLPPSSQSILPRYPLLLVDDVPLALCSGYRFISSPSALIRVYAAWFLRAGPVRRHPLRPMDNPLRARKTLVDSEAWRTFVRLERSDQEMVYLQLVRMVYNLADIAEVRQLYDAQDLKNGRPLRGN